MIPKVHSYGRERVTSHRSTSRADHGQHLARVPLGERVRIDGDRVADRQPQRLHGRCDGAGQALREVAVALGDESDAHERLIELAQRLRAGQQ